MNHRVRISFRAMIFSVAVATLLPIACYEENPVSDNPIDYFEPPTVVGVDPENGASEVDRYSQVTVRFSQSMDTVLVSSNFHVSGGSAMRQWMDSLAQGRGSSNWAACDDSCMMKWLDSISYTGRLLWNSALDSCVFQPDSLLLPNTQHMLFLSAPIRARTGAQMCMDTMAYGGFVSFFQTGP